MAKELEGGQTYVIPVKRIRNRLDAAVQTVMVDHIVGEAQANQAGIEHRHDWFPGMPAEDKAELDETLGEILERRRRQRGE